MEHHDTFISFKSHLYSKQESPILRLLGSWSAVFVSMFELIQIFSNNSNLIVLVVIQHLHENGKYF